VVLSLLKQLEPAQPDPQHDEFPAPGTTADQLDNAAKLLHGSGFPNASCTTVGANAAPTGTVPVIAPLCWADALGVNVTSGAQVRRTTAPPLRLAMTSSFDPAVMNAWGQVAGSEARWLGITGIYGPQVDLTRIPNWGRNDTNLGEDPFVDGTMAAAEINGIQGKGLMDQTKHFAMYNGQIMFHDTMVQDQAAHELYLTPYEYATTGSGTVPNPGLASSMMCSYQRYEIVAAPGVTGIPDSVLGPTGGDLACDNKVMNDVARNQWGWQGFFASDYGFAMDSTKKSITNGNDQEMPTQVFFGPGLVAAVEAHQVPLSTFNRALARILYQEDRFHLLGHADANSNYLSPSNPTDTAGQWSITQAQKTYDGSIVERTAEEGALLLKNDNRTLPLTPSDLGGNVLVLGEAAEYMPAESGVERANGYHDRDAISPLQQLKQFAPFGSHITYLPYVSGSAPTVGDGVAVPQAVLSTDGTTSGNGLTRTSGPGSPRVDPQIDFTSVSGLGQLALATPYTWTGYVDVPTADDYTFHFQFTVPNVAPAPESPFIPGFPNPTASGPSCSGSGAPTFQLAQSAGVGQSMRGETLSSTGSTLSAIPTNPTMSGYTERGLANCLFHAGTLSAGVHRIQLSWTTPAGLGTDAYNIREPGSTSPSLRFAYSRTVADLGDAVSAAQSASKVLVFADCACPGEVSLTSPNTNSLDANTTGLINAVAGANQNTVVVLNVNVPTLLPWLDKVKSVLQMWYPGGEGGTATARLLLGLANPGGHTIMTWPAHDTDTIFGYDETRPLYPGDTTGVHPERLSQTPPVKFTEGLFIGYRFFDREGITPLFPYGYGLSYTTFRFSNLSVTPSQGGLDVSFDVTNTGSVTGAEVPQVYVGPAPSVPSGVQQADRSIRGFDRVVLAPGAVAHKTIHLGPGSDVNGHGDRRAFQYWSSPDQQWKTADGPRSIWVGDADALANLPLYTLATPAPGAGVTTVSPTGGVQTIGLANTGAAVTATALIGLPVAGFAVLGRLRRRARDRKLV